MLANENIILSDRVMRLQVENEHLVKQNMKLKATFFELIQEYERFRNQSTLIFDRESFHMWVERAGILDEYDNRSDGPE